ncbi:MAG TPA: cytochrome c [Myxococcota bacterium]|nr:cytochrome c [Myxococcota bacterium]
MRNLLTSLAVLAVPLTGSACGKSGFEGPMTFGDRVVPVATLERGQDLYNRYCATCHGYNGKADTPQARQLDPLPRDLSKADYKRVSSPGALPTDKELAEIIRNGIPGTGMPPWPQLEGSDLDAVIQYLKTFSPRWQSPTSAPPQKDGKGAMKALPVESTAASFRAAHDLGNPEALAQGLRTSGDASAGPSPRLSRRPSPTNDSADPHASASRLIGSHDLALGPSPTDTDKNPRSTR